MMKIINNRVAAVIGGAVVLAALSGTTGAYASRLIGSADIRDGAVHRVDLSDGVNTALAKQAQDGESAYQLWKDAGNTGTKAAFLASLKGDKGDPGLSHLIVGAGYAGLGAHDYWAPHSYGETIETCPEGQNAIGGGYSQDASTGGDGKYDLGGKSDVQITVSAPYFKGDYVPVDDAGNFRADQWVVRGYNNGDTQVDVRAWVVCATVK